MGATHARLGRIMLTLTLGCLVVAGCQVMASIQSTPEPVFDPAPPAGWAWHDNAVPHRGEHGQLFDFACPPGGGLGSIWGTDTYTDDSSVCTAAVHVGLFTREEGGIARIVVRPGLEAYQGSVRNGIISEDYGSWEGSFTVLTGCRGQACGVVLAPSPSG